MTVYTWTLILFLCFSEELWNGLPFLSSPTCGHGATCQFYCWAILSHRLNLVEYQLFHHPQVSSGLVSLWILLARPIRTLFHSLFSSDLPSKQLNMPRGNACWQRLSLWLLLHFCRRRSLILHSNSHLNIKHHIQAKKAVNSFRCSWHECNVWSWGNSSIFTALHSGSFTGTFHQAAFLQSTI